MNDLDFNKKLLEACESCASTDSSESHSYEKSFNTETGSVSVEAHAETVEELKVLLQKVGITLPSGQPEVGHDHDHSPCDDSEEPMKIVKVDAEPNVNPYNAGTPDKQVLTNIIRDRLKDYLRNSQS